MKATLQIKEKSTGKTAPFFVLEVTARSAADEVSDSPVELDENYFGGRHKGKRGHRAAGKVVVFGILKRHDKIYTVVVNNTKTETLSSVIKQKIMPDSTVHTDSLSSCCKPDVNGSPYHCINLAKAFADRQNHIDGVENFWNQVKRVLHKYNGINR